VAMIAVSTPNSLADAAPSHNHERQCSRRR
jgi:hypothetical protein